ncbi:FUSC family protein [Streptomyces auratus]|uniref:FUSC family protein n=1 Tax=Streptomyces auratus TaxID=114687 RepID=UPI001FE564FE|nr:aromatic acid exporter family protein [Streptomyces auratus]
MSERVGEERAEPARQDRLARIGQWWKRAWGSEGLERHTALLIGKSTLAATIAWLVSSHVLHAQSPAFAPFSAVLIMQVTVYRSLLDSSRYVAAVAAGVAVQAASGFLVGPDVPTFALVALIALTIGRWPALGSQGSQVATAAFFAFSTYVSATSNLDKATQLGQIILLVLIGCGIGILVNVAVLPPLRYRGAEHGIRTLAHALCDLVGDVYPALRAHDVDPERTERWRARAGRTGDLVTEARAGLRTAQESLHYNPRPLFRRHRGRPGFAGYGAVLEALERTLHQVASLTRSLDRWSGDEDRYRYESFLECYADFLASVSEITRVLAGLDEDRLHEQAPQLCHLADQAQQCRRRVAEQAERDALPLADPARPYGVLVVEATRLMEEFQYTCDVLQHHVDQHRH